MKAKGASKGKRPSRWWLLLNHMDAWQVALIIAMVALLNHNAVTPRTLWLLAAIGIGYWLAFAFNDYCDAPYDAVDAEKASRNYFASTAARRKLVRVGFWLVGGLLLAAFLPFGWRGVAAYALSLVIMWAYSAPPLRLKQRPGFDLLLHALFVQTFPYVLMLLLIGARWTALDVTLVSMFVLASLAAQLEQQVRDYEVDRQSGRTFTTQIGRRRTMVLLRLVTLLLLGIAAHGVATRRFPAYLLPFGAIGLPALLHRFVRRAQTPRSEWLVLTSTTLGFVYTGIIFVYFLLQSSQ